MSDDQDVGAGGKGPQSDEDLTHISEEIIEKLKLLNYEKEFLSHKGHKPLSKPYFAVQLNPNEQFTYFTTLVKWLLSLNDINAGELTKYNDPTTVASNIQVELKKLGIECEFPPLKLKSGSGEYVCFVLQQLLNRALKSKKFKFKEPRFDNKEKADEEPEEVEGKDVEDADAVPDNLEVDTDSDVDLGEGKITQEQGREMIESNIDSKEWELEVERVAPRLKIPLQNDAKEWRNHIEQAKTYGQTIKKSLPDARGKLERMSENLSKVLEKITGREKRINVNMNELGTEYKAKAEDLKVNLTRYHELEKSVKEKREDLRKVSEKYDAIMGKISQSSNEATDSSSLVKIKTAIQKLKQDIKAMDLRAGVLSHTVMQHKVREKRNPDDAALAPIEEIE